MALTKQDLEAIEGIVNKQVAPVDTKVGSLRQEMQGEFALVHQDIKEVRSDITALREQIQELTATLDKFLKQLADLREDFEILMHVCRARFRRWERGVIRAAPEAPQSLLAS